MSKASILAGFKTETTTTLLKTRPHDAEVNRRLAGLEAQANSGGSVSDRLAAIEQRLDAINAFIKKEWG